MTVGTLTQAYTFVTWGGQNLSAFDVGGTMENMAQQVSVKLNKDESAPTCNFQITPNPAGFQLFQEIKSGALDQPFTVKYGYLNGSETPEWSFLFTGVQLTTGLKPMLQIEGVSQVKGAWTDNKITFTMEEEMPLSAYPDFVKEKCGEGCKDMTFTWVGQAKEVASSIMVKGNQMQRAPHTILTDVLRPHGILVQVSDDAIDNQIILSYSPVKEGELEVDKPTVNSSGQPGGSAERTVYIIGPGLMENVTRKQSFNVGSTLTNNAAAPESPTVAQTNQATVAQPQNAAPQTTTGESSNEAGGTSGQNNPGSANTGSTPDPANDADATAAIAKAVTTEINFNVLMVPYMVGIKPRDLIAIPSLAGPGSYVEDWEVTDVGYTQNNTGGVRIDIRGQRPYTGEESLLDSGSLSAVKSTAASLTTPEAWARFYWVQG